MGRWGDGEMGRWGETRNLKPEGFAAVGRRKRQGGLRNIRKVRKGGCCSRAQGVWGAGDVIGTGGAALDRIAGFRD